MDQKKLRIWTLFTQCLNTNDCPLFKGKHFITVLLLAILAVSSGIHMAALGEMKATDFL